MTNADLAPTILDAAGRPPRPAPDGRSLFPLLADPGSNGAATCWSRARRRARSWRSTRCAPTATSTRVQHRRARALRPRARPVPARNARTPIRARARLQPRAGGRASALLGRSARAGPAARARGPDLACARLRGRACAGRPSSRACACAARAGSRRCEPGCGRATAAW